MASLFDPLRKMIKGTTEKAEPGLVEVAACPFCGGEPRTLVCPYNRFLLLDERPDEKASRYDYCLCHTCGSVYASKRPAGEGFRHLSSTFNETLGRQSSQPGSKILLNPNPLTERDRQRIRNLSQSGVLVSEHSGLHRSKWLPAILRDKMANAVHIDLIGSLIDIKGARILEIRSRTGSNLETLRRLYGAEVYALPMFESQKVIIESFFDLPAEGLIDFEDFSIPYEGPFDLILCNHMLTHAVAPERLFAALRAALKPNGHIYFYNEPDDRKFIERLKVLYNVLNPFHLQTFDGPSLVRALAANQFEAVFLNHVGHDLICLARLAPDLPRENLPDDELADRVEHYRKSRDWAFIRVPESARAILGGDWDEICRRLEADGLIARDKRGKLRDIRGRMVRPH